VNAYLTPAATAAIKAANAAHIERNNQRRRERAFVRAMVAMREPMRSVPAFPPSGLVKL